MAQPELAASRCTPSSIRIVVRERDTRWWPHPSSRDNPEQWSTTVERKIVSMAPEQYGWKIEVPERAPVTIADMPLAILVACNLARAEHRASGNPTAVKVRMLCGDGVMMGFCG
jgi:hypothetical protein